MEKASILIVTLCVIAFALTSARLQRTFVTPPMVFALLGLLLGPQWLGWLSLPRDSTIIHTLAEITLILVLFTDAARIDLKLLKREHDIPIRLLVIGMPLTILLGTLIAAGMFAGLSFWECAVLAAILAPTDAALGQAVVSSKRVPVRIRQALNVESGLNDGIALPAVLLLVAVAGAMGQAESTTHWVGFITAQLVLGPLAGIAVGYAGAQLLDLSTKNGWITHTFQDLAVMALAFLAFFGAELIGGNGFIAAFCAGLVLGNSVRSMCTCIYKFAESEGQLLNLSIFLFFGIILLPIVVAEASLTAVIYALLSLTVIRLLPVALSLVGARLRGATVLFLGWFGPRGLASILFALLVVEQSELPGREPILTVVLTTVFFSIFLHGATAGWGATRYATELKKCGDKGMPIEAEHQHVTEMPARLSMPNE